MSETRSAAARVRESSLAVDLEDRSPWISKASKANWAAQVRSTLKMLADFAPPPPPPPRSLPPGCPHCGVLAGGHWGDCPSAAPPPTRPEAMQIQRIRTSYKGQAVKRIAHREWRAPTKATLPARNLRLPDGRLLVYQGPETINGVPAGWWITADRFKVGASVDPTRWGNQLHLSMSYPDHDPDWEDILAVRYTFYPYDIDIMMILPRDGEYVNIHDHVFQIRPTPEAWNDGAPFSTKQESKVGRVKGKTQSKAQAQNAGKAGPPRGMGQDPGMRLRR